MDARNPKRNVSDVFAVARPGAVFPPPAAIDFGVQTQKPGHWFLQRVFNYIFSLSFDSLQVRKFIQKKKKKLFLLYPHSYQCDLSVVSTEFRFELLKIIKNIVIHRFYYSSATPRTPRPSIFGDISQGDCKCDVMFKLIQTNIVENLMIKFFLTLICVNA